MKWTTCTLFGSQFCFQCNQCNQHLERDIMPNIKITAEINGKQVSLENISTETFEAIKALEKPKEIPVARLATRLYYDPSSRLLIKPTTEILLKPGRVYSFDLGDGALVAEWDLKEDERAINNTYTDVRPL